MNKTITALQEMMRTLTPYLDAAHQHLSHAPASDLAVDLICAEFPGIKKQLLQSYIECDDFKLKWSFDQNNDAFIIEGESNIPGLLDMFFTTGENIYWHPDVTFHKTFDQFTKRLILLDQYLANYDGTRSVAIELNEDKVAIKRLWYWNDEGDKYPLSIAFEDYLDTLIQNKGIVNWPLFYIDFDQVNFKDDYAREWLYGTTIDGYKNDMKAVLEIAKKIDQQLYERLNERYKETVTMFKQLL